ncbi:hypothetical protein ABPG77_010189 [Micractinium sp. CCAP 211/92]
MGLRLSTTASAASGTKAASHPRKRFGRLRRLQCFTAVEESSVEVVEWFGKYHRIARPGFSCVLCCFGQSVAGRLSTALQHHEVQCECKTKDSVFVELVFSIQYRVAEDRLYDAFYSLADPEAQVTSYVLDAVSSAISGMELEELFQKRNDMVKRVRRELGDLLHRHGFAIEDCLVTVLTPAPTVKEAMSNVLASRRNKESAAEQGEADKLRAVKAAEGSAESKYLQGQGFARLMVALAAGSREALRVMVTGRIRREDLAFPEPPPRDEPAALAAAGVHEALPAPSQGGEKQLDGAGPEAGAPWQRGSTITQGGSQAEIEPIPVAAEAVPPAQAARRKAPAGGSADLRQALLGDDPSLPGAASAAASPAGTKPGLRHQLLAPPTPSKAVPASPRSQQAAAGWVAPAVKAAGKAGL